MKLYLPYPHLSDSACCFHPEDLECTVELSLDALVFILKGYTRPWVEMWIDHEFQLMEYAEVLLATLLQRAQDDVPFLPLAQRFDDIHREHYGRLCQRIVTPSWLYEEQLYESHRIALIKWRPDHYEPFWPDALVEADSPTYWPKHKRGSASGQSRRVHRRLDTALWWRGTAL